MISVSGLNVKRGDFQLNEINLNVADKECLTILGPNGCGKTTILECIAGLNPCSGKVFLDGVDVSELPPEKRKVGYVPQDFVLFPHLTADQNINFGLLNQKTKNTDAAERASSLLGIDHLKGRDVRTLSAGEKQKVALARALAIQPKILLLDEPFAALDPVAKERLRRELQVILTRVLDTLMVPVIYVTHDLSEAFMMSNQIAVMSRGKIEQIGFKEGVFDNPCSPFVAEFLGFNLFEGKVTSILGEKAIIMLGDKTIEVANQNFASGLKISLAIKPQDIRLSLDSDVKGEKWKCCQCNVLEGTVVDVINLGSMARIIVDVGILLKSDITAEKLEELELTIGKKVFAQFKNSKLKIIT